MTKKAIKTEPKPTMSCPCCDGEELELFEGEYADGEQLWFVCCLDCGTEGPHGSTAEEACRLWDAKHSRHRIGERNTAPAHAKAAMDAAADAAAPVLNVPTPPDPAVAMASAMAGAMATTESPAEVIEKQMRKRPFFALATGLLQPGA